MVKIQAQAMAKWVNVPPNHVSTLALRNRVSPQTYALLRSKNVKILTPITSNKSRYWL